MAGAGKPSVLKQDGFKQPSVAFISLTTKGVVGSKLARIGAMCRLNWRSLVSSIFPLPLGPGSMPIVVLWVAPFPLSAPWLSMVRGGSDMAGPAVCKHAS